MSSFNKRAEQQKQILHFDPDPAITRLLQQYLPATIPGGRVNVVPVHQLDDFLLLNSLSLDVVVFGLNDDKREMKEQKRYEQIFLEMINRQPQRKPPTEFVLHLPYDPEYDKPQYFFVGRAEPIIVLAGRVRQALGMSENRNWQ